MTDTIIKVSYRDFETMPKRLKKRAEELDLTVEELVRRFIAEGMKGEGLNQEAEGKGFSSLSEMLSDTGVTKKSN